MRKAAAIGVGLAAWLVLAGELGFSFYAGPWGDPNAGWQESDLSFRPWQSFFATDFQYFNARSEDGVLVYGAYYGFHYGILDEWGFNYAVIEPDGSALFSRTSTQDPKIAGSAYSYSSPEAVAEGNREGFHLRLQDNKSSLDLTFRPLTPGFKPGNGLICFTPDCGTYQFSNSPAPLAQVTGVVTGSGKPIRFQGLGYYERGGDSLPLYRQNPKSFYTYSYDPAAPPGPDRIAINFLTYQSHPAYGGFTAAWLTIVQADRIVFAAKDFTCEPGDFQADPVTGFAFPHRFLLQAKGEGVELNARVLAERQTELLDILAELPAPLRPLAAKFFGRPVYWRASARLQGALLLGGKTYPLDLPALMGANYVR